MDLMHGTGREIAKGEAAEKELDSFISRRHENRRKDEEQQRVEDAWKASERVQEATRRRENRAGWYGWHSHRAELYAALSREHAATARELMGEGAA